METDSEERLGCVSKSEHRSKTLSAIQAQGTSLVEEYRYSIQGAAPIQPRWVYLTERVRFRLGYLVSIVQSFHSGKKYPSLQTRTISQARHVAFDFLVLGLIE